MRASSGVTGERSYYPVLANLLGAVGRTLKPKVLCVLEVADQVRCRTGNIRYSDGDFEPRKFSNSPTPRGESVPF